VIADHHPLCRAGLADLLSHRLGISDVVQASDFAHTLAAIARSPDIDMVTISLDLPELRGVAGLRRLRTDHPSLRVVVVAESRERDLVLDALCAGVHGYILKDTPPDEMVRAFEMIVAGHVYVPSLVSDIRARRAAQVMPAGQASLTERQIEVLQLIAAGRSNKEIARSLEIAEGTVKVHITAAFRALGVHNRVSAAAAMQVRPRNDNALQSLLPGLLAN
jgi:DNA-binding NarL/FixJ family response regulator